MSVTVLIRNFVTQRAGFEGSTHEWQAAVVADCDLWLVRVDEDARMTRWSAAAVACHNAIVRPADGLLVDELHSGVRLGL